MKKLTLVILVGLAALSLAQSGSADTISTFNTYGPYQSGSGGEFTLLASGPTLTGLVSLYLSGTTSDILQSGTFQSICLEQQEYIALNTIYNVSLSDRAVWGGVGPGGDPISQGTAYLYYQFATGTLPGYDYSLPGRLASAAALQNAIWYLEGEIGPVSNPFVTLVTTQFGSFANAQLDNNNAYPVAVLNLTSVGTGTRAQDQLILTPVPEPLTLLLLGLGLVGVAGIRRKLQS